MPLVLANNRTAATRVGRVAANRPRNIVVVARRIPDVVRWSFLLFVSSIPFEETDIGVMSGSLSPAKISGVLFFVIYIVCHGGLFAQRSFPRLPASIWCFIGYVVVYIVHGIFIPREVLGSYMSRLVTLVQLIVLFWAASHLLREEKLARRACLVFVVSSVVLAVGSMFQVFGISVTQLAHGRATTLEYNAGTLGVLMALSILMMVGLYLNRSAGHIGIGALSFVLMLAPLKVLLSSGSRGALVTLMIGCLVYVLPAVSIRSRLTAIAVGVATIVAAGYLAFSNPDYSERWEETYYEGKVSGRDVIYTAAIEMIVERPLFGWQPVLHWYELGSRVGRPERDEHSLFLHLLAEVGLFGAVPFVIGLWLCSRDAWRARKGPLGSLPLALVLGVLSANITDTFITRKPLWFILALTVAARSSATERRVIVMQRAQAHRGGL